MTTMGVDAPSSADVPQRGGFLGFLGTIPGILTALAGVITALASLLYIVHLAAGSPEPSPEPSSEVQPAPEPPADAADLYTDCANGDMYSCDTLYWISPVGSADEAYGATCGGLFFDWQYGTCSEL